MVLEYGGNTETEFAVEYQLMPDGALRPALRIKPISDGKAGGWLKLARI